MPSDVSLGVDTLTVPQAITRKQVGYLHPACQHELELVSGRAGRDSSVSYSLFIPAILSIQSIFVVSRRNASCITVSFTVFLLQSPPA
jgi:hypothetical protein